jgi:hypothetical protein
MTEGMMEAGQGAGLINKILTVKELFDEFMMEFEKSKSRICSQ